MRPASSNTSTHRKGIGVVCLIIALICCIYAISSFNAASSAANTPVMCGGQVMSPSDTCSVTYGSSNNDGNGGLQYTYGEQQNIQNMTNAQNAQNDQNTGIAGIILACFLGLVGLVALFKRS